MTSRSRVPSSPAIRGLWKAVAVGFLLCLVCTGLPHRASAWGDKTHPALSDLAVGSLSGGAAVYFRPHALALARLSNDPDTILRARYGREEKIRHFIDLDAFMSPPFVGFPRMYRDAVRRFGKSAMGKNGVVPWVILRFRRQLREAIRSGDTDRAVREAAYLGHYVADSFQPLHLTKDYDGQRIHAKGIHRRFENGIVDDHILELSAEVRRKLPRARVLHDVRSKVFTALFRSYKGVDVLLRAEEKVRRETKVGSPEYYRRLDALVHPLVVRQLTGAASMMGSLWMTAWTEAQQGSGAR